MGKEETKSKREKWRDKKKVNGNETETATW